MPSVVITSPLALRSTSVGMPLTSNKVERSFLSWRSSKSRAMSWSPAEVVMEAKYSSKPSLTLSEDTKTTSNFFPAALSFS